MAEAALSGPVVWNPIAPARAGFQAPRPPGTGEPLGKDLRKTFEKRLGADLSGVRVHRDLGAERAAKRENAKAFALGRDIYFGTGSYAPDTSDGRRLLAHELAHTVQQSNSGIHTVQREDNPGPAFTPQEIARMTDEQKAEIRREFEELAKLHAEAFFQKVASRPDLGQLPPEQQARVSALRSLIIQAQKGAQQVSDPQDRSLRLELLKALEPLLDDKIFVHLYLEDPGILVLSTLEELGDPTTTSDAEQRERMAYEASLFRQGGRSLTQVALKRGLYAEAQVDPEALKTEQLTAEEAAAAGASPDTLTFEDQQRLREVFDAIPEDGAARSSLDPNLLAQKLREMDDETLRHFLEFLRQTPDPETEGSPVIEDHLEAFLQLSPLERDTLLLNRQLSDQAAVTGGLDGKVLLALATSSDPMRQDAAKLDSNLARVAALITDKDKLKGLNPISIDVGLFALDIALFHGLLAGGASESEAVRDAVTDLTAEIAKAQEELMEKIGAEIAVTAALIAVPGVGELKALDSLRKANELRKHLETIQRVYSISVQISEIITLFANAGEALQQFQSFIDEAGSAYTVYLSMLDELDEVPELDEKIAEFEDKLAERFDTLLDGELADILGMLYLPPDAPPEELLRIIFNLPKGIDALKVAWDFRQTADPKDPEGAERVLVRAAFAGKLLHPFVGFVAAQGAQQISEAFPDKSIAEHVVGKLAGYKKRKADRSASNRSTFFRLNRKNYDYNEADLVPILKRGARRLKVLAEEEEPGGHWLAPWLRIVLREKVQVLNREFSKETVRARIKPKKASKQTAASTPQTVDAPLPLFRLKFLRGDSDPLNEIVHLQLNPTDPTEFDTLSNSDFGKPSGVAFKIPGEEKRNKLLMNWLLERNYIVVPDTDNNPHIRRSGGRTASEGRDYLHIDDTTSPHKIRSGIRKEDYKRFLGITVIDSQSLPEGFYLKRTTAGDTVVRKDGIRSTDAAPMLGMKESRQLTDTDRATLKPVEILAPGVTEPSSTDLEPYDWEASIAATASGAEYSNDTASLELWKTRVSKSPDMKTRPKHVSGVFGYTLRARALGDHLPNALPELKNTDDKGHLVAKRFGGTDNIRNIVPMDRRVNQFPGDWFELERDISKVYMGSTATPGHRAHVSIDVEYPNERSRRPEAFKVRWQEQDEHGSTVSGGRGSTGTKNIKNH